MKFTTNRYRPLSHSEKRVLAVITARVLMITSADPGESNEYDLVLNLATLKQAFPSITKSRMFDLIQVILSARFDEGRLGYERCPIIANATIQEGGEEISLTLSPEYMDCVIQLGCLPL